MHCTSRPHVVSVLSHVPENILFSSGPMVMDVEAEISPPPTGPEAAAAGVFPAAGERQRLGWLKGVVTTTTPRRRRRGHCSPVGVELKGVAAPEEDAEKTRRLIVPGEYVHRRQPRRWWKLQGGSSSRLAAGLSRSLRRWKPGSLSGSWATALADAVAFRVMYVMEAVVLGLALSCFFCCCGCQV
ncbi:hypothetical protein ABZP36_025357 [Zizania latifolia]